MVLEGYQFAEGRINRLTRPQMDFLSHVFMLRLELKTGKKSKRSGGPSINGKTQRGGMSISGTPEQVAAKMLPKFEKMDKFAREKEIENAQKAIAAWEEMQRKIRAQKESGRG